MTNHTRNNEQNLTGKLYFVCKHCWLYLRPPSTLHEPCRGCTILEGMGWEFWTPSRGRSAWWRHPCWMFILIFFLLDSHRNLDNVTLRFLINFVSSIIKDGPAYSICSNWNVDFFIRFPLDYWPCNDFSRLAHPSSTLYRSSLDSHWILQDIMIFRSWPIPHKLCIVNHQGWSSLLHLFKPKR